MSTGSKTIADLPEVQILDDKDQFLFFQNSSKKAKKITRNNMLNSRGFVTALQAAGVGASDTVAPNTPALPTVTTATERDKDGTEKVYIKASVAANSETDLASYSWSLRRANGTTPIFAGGYLSSTTSANGNGEATSASYSGTAQIFDAVTNVAPAPQGQKMQWDVRANAYYEVRVSAIDKSGNRSSYTALTGPSNGTVILSARDTSAPNPPTNVVASSAIKSVFLDWVNDTASDLAGVKIYRNTVNNFSTATLKVTVYATSYTDTSTVQGASYYYWLTSIDYSGNESATQATPTPSPIVPGLVANTDITTFAVDATKMFTNTVILKTDVWTDNSPSAGYIAWNAHTLVYGGASYSITAGSTNLQFVYWTGGTTYQVNDTNPALTDGQFMIATNAKNAVNVAQGIHDLAWNAMANAVIGSAYIQNAAITNAKISELNADKIRTGSITSQTITLDSDGVFKSSGATSYTTGSGFWLEGGATPRFKIGDLTASTNGFLQWDTSTSILTVKGEIKATSGFFGSASTAVSVGNLGLSVGTTGRITSGLEWSSSGAGNFTQSGSGFFLGYASNLYRFFIGETGAAGTGGANYLYWDGSALKIGGQITGGTSIENAPAGVTDGLVINSTIGIRKGNATGTLTITGGAANGISSGAQIDFGGNALSDGNRGVLILQGGSAGASLDNGRIEFKTNSFDGTIGVTRGRFNTAGEFIVYRNANNGSPGLYTDGSGCAQFQANVGIGRPFLSVNAPGVNTGTVTGNLHVQTQIAVYNGNAQTIILNGSDGYATATRFTTTSSKRFKTNIKKLNLGMETVSKLRPVSFKRKGEGGENDIGLIAEEVEKIIPSIVSKNEKGECVGLDYSKLTVVLIQAVKQLQLEVERLKNKIK